MPKLKIDGIEVKVPAGATVLQAGEIAGREIARFCLVESRPELERRSVKRQGGDLSPMQEAAE